MLGACLVDQSAAYTFQRVGTSRMYAVSIDRHALGISADAVPKAAGRLDRSPLLAMVTRHVIDVARIADTTMSGPATTMLGTATAELVRAVLTTALTAADPFLDASAATLLAVTQAHVDRHITDAGLTPDRIARAHSVSLRTLYAAWAGNDLSLSAYIMAQRLELARRALVEPGSRVRTIAAVARHYGFVDATHFARRFREAYGLSPREWRQLASRTRTAHPAPIAAH